MKQTDSKTTTESSFGTQIYSSDGGLYQPVLLVLLVHSMMSDSLTTGGDARNSSPLMFIWTSRKSIEMLPPAAVAAEFVNSTGKSMELLA